MEIAESEATTLRREDPACDWIYYERSTTGRNVSDVTSQKGNSKGSEGADKLPTTNSDPFPSPPDNTPPDAIQTPSGSGGGGDSHRGGRGPRGGTDTTRGGGDGRGGGSRASQDNKDISDSEDSAEDEAPRKDEVSSRLDPRNIKEGPRTRRPNTKYAFLADDGEDGLYDYH